MGSTIHKIKDLQNVVKELLTQHPTYRDNDRKLVAHIWMKQVGGVQNMRAYNLYDFMRDWIDDDAIIMPDTITRARRKVQQDNSHLRGESYVQRQNEEKEVRQNINT